MRWENLKLAGEINNKTSNSYSWAYIQCQAFGQDRRYRDELQAVQSLKNINFSFKNQKTIEVFHEISLTFKSKEAWLAQSVKHTILISGYEFKTHNGCRDLKKKKNSSRPIK